MNKKKNKMSKKSYNPVFALFKWVMSHQSHFKLIHVKPSLIDWWIISIGISLNLLFLFFLFWTMSSDVQGSSLAQLSGITPGSVCEDHIEWRSGIEPRSAMHRANALPTLLSLWYPLNIFQWNAKDLSHLFF